jgi:glycosyltransferase involved in cell wall biosynthesis
VGVPPGDVSALAAACRGLIEDAGTRQALGRNARQTALDRFRRVRLGPQVLELYRRILHLRARVAA